MPLKVLKTEPPTPNPSPHHPLPPPLPLPLPSPSPPPLSSSSPPLTLPSPPPPLPLPSGSDFISTHHCHPYLRTTLVIPHGNNDDERLETISSHNHEVKAVSHKGGGGGGMKAVSICKVSFTPRSSGRGGGGDLFRGLCR